MEQAVDNIHDTSALADDADESNGVADIDDQDQWTGFPGGPTEHHVARRLWEGEDRESLKVITHGLKLKKFAEVPMSAPVEHWIQESGLMHLSSGYLTMADVVLISAFVERWHRETSSFHLPFREMTITLDDVATLLHISPHDYSWASATLVFLYDNLRDGAVYDTRQVRRYMTLLQCWIYEHFPRINKRGDRGAVPAHLPRACRWTAKHVVEGGLMAYRRRLDALLLEDVVFTPYDDDRANHPFVSILMFSGYLRCGGVSVPYLPE
uniref:Protein MAIN-LIKE 2-like n=1 Tax=Cicer arietinum TaxID=3827 RepID=A0A1S3DVU3_CICAR|nr:protein MAIN-LIKE 2-like [Cicer arietinum]